MNLMLSDFCNLHCSYCFAKGAMSKAAQEMSEEMSKILYFNVIVFNGKMRPMFCPFRNPR